jgi:RNA polymerase sigma-70 factor (ECF subfamily)
VSEASGVGASGDDALVARARDGDMAAFEELVMRHADRLYGSLRRFGLDDVEAQEVAQETFLRAWRGLKSFRGDARFFTWLYRIGFNEAQRRLARRPGASVVPGGDEALETVADAAPSPAAEAEIRELREALVRALGDLPVDLRAPVILRDVEGLSTREAASVLELSEAAFKSRLHRGRMALRNLLGPWLAAGMS